MNGSAVRVPDLAELVNAAHASVCEHEGARFQHPLPVVFHLEKAAAAQRAGVLRVRARPTRAPLASPRCMHWILTAAQVRPALVVPMPVVRTERDDNDAANRRNCDLPEGHPRRNAPHAQRRQGVTSSTRQGKSRHAPHPRTRAGVSYEQDV